ncbi:DUF4136 domain-containing protein [Zestomonas thermotolerans]|uniref:DUF4136 domain-containing protein n=1 Tax=Zestomonas thermotolerans TaxID=157784 RepID=UPI00035DB1A2|nr:DUF4136 domain-containing protein [Pseudomonas thermotolerans]
MRVIALILLCLGLATCASHIPQIHVVQSATPELAGRQSFQLMPPEQAKSAPAPYPQRYAELGPLLRQGLLERGYRDSQTPQLLAYYWLTLDDHPLEYRVDISPPEELGPYQAVHRLRDEAGTLRLRLASPDGQVLWEGTVSTGLSPGRYRVDYLQRAVRALLQQLPEAHP